jgi:hypothetical protein
VKKIKRVHLVYPVGNKISTPDTIGRHLKLALEKYYQVITYNYDQFKTIHPGNADVLIGHWHPNPLTVFRMSAKKKGWKRILALAPFCPDHLGWHNGARARILFHPFFLALILKTVRGFGCQCPINTSALPG